MGGLSTGTVSFADIGWHFAKELSAALANGAIAAGVLIALVLGIAEATHIDAPVTLGLTAGLALVTVVVVAVAVGASIPIVLDRFGIDPAMATGVFITTGNDTLSVMTFFALVSVLYLSSGRHPRGMRRLQSSSDFRVLRRQPFERTRTQVRAWPSPPDPAGDRRQRVTAGARNERLARRSRAAASRPVLAGCVRSATRAGENALRGRRR